MPGHRPDHPLNFLTIRALGLPPGKAPKTEKDPKGDADLRKWQREVADFRLMLAPLRRAFDHLPEEAQRFVSEYLRNGLDATQAARDAELLKLKDPTDRTQWTTMDYESRAMRIQKNVYVRAVTLAALKLGRYDTPDKTELRALSLSDVYRARSVHDRVQAIANVIKLLGKDIGVVPEVDDGDALFRKAAAIEAGIRAKVVNERTGAVEPANGTARDTTSP